MHSPLHLSAKESVFGGTAFVGCLVCSHTFVTHDPDDSAEPSSTLQGGTSTSGLKVGLKDKEQFQAIVQCASTVCVV